VRLSNDYSDFTEKDGQLLETATEGPEFSSTAGGGVVIFVTEDFSYDPLSMAMVGDPNGSYVKIDDQAPTLGAIPALATFDGAQTGKVFHLNPYTQNFTMIV